MWESDHKEDWALKNWCFWTVVLEKTLESPFNFKEIKPVNPKGNESWIFFGRTDAETETPVLWPPDIKKKLTHSKRPWCWERLKVGGEGDDRGWDDWMASPTQGTWVWASSGSWWWTGRPGMLQSMGSQRVGRDWAAELKWTNETIGLARKFFWLLSKNKRHNFLSHQELYWTAYSLCFPTFCHFLGNFIISSSQSFLSFWTKKSSQWFCYSLLRY